MTATLEPPSIAAQEEARALGLRPVPSEAAFGPWFEIVAENFRAISVAECRAVLDRYLGRPVGELDRFRECNALYCFTGAIENRCLAERPRLSGRARRRVDLFLAYLNQFKIDGAPEASALAGALEARFLSFRGQLGESRLSFAQLNQRIKGSADRLERQAAWDATLPLARENREQMLALVASRNRLARQAGYRDFIDWRWRESALDEEWLLALLDRLEVATQAPYDKALGELADSLGVARLMPWDMAYAIEQISPLSPEHFDCTSAGDRLRHLLSGWGFTEEEGRVPLHHSENFPMGGLCFGIEPGKEVAILLSPVDGPRYYRTFFHEYGHAMHFRHAGQGDILLNVEDMIFNDGMAVFFESFASDPAWVAENLPLDEAEAARYCRQARLATLTWLRTLIHNIRFEYALYTEENFDPEACYLALSARCGGYDLDPACALRWAADQMTVSHPVYWHNYLIAELIARQIRETLLLKDGHLLGNKAVKPFLMERCYGPGAMVPWPTKVLEATGRELDGEAFFRFLSQAESSN